MELLYIVKNSTKPEIEIAGMPIKKVSLAAVCLSIPENNAEVKVIPDLETPGNIARDCEKPSKIISLNLISFKYFFFVPHFSERANKKAMIIETMAIENKLLKYESEKPGQNTLTSKPKNNIGILAIKI